MVMKNPMRKMLLLLLAGVVDECNEVVDECNEISNH